MATLEFLAFAWRGIYKTARLILLPLYTFSFGWSDLRVFIVCGPLQLVTHLHGVRECCHVGKKVTCLGEFGYLISSSIILMFLSSLHWEINSRFCSKTQWQLFLLLSSRLVGAHPNGLYPGCQSFDCERRRISIAASLRKQLSGLMGSSMASPYKSLQIWVKSFCAKLKPCIKKIAVTWILARVFAYLPSFFSQILDFFYWTGLISVHFDQLWMAWHWKPAAAQWGVW